MLQGIKITYYSDCGINPADNSLILIGKGMDNGLALNIDSYTNKIKILEQPILFSGIEKFKKKMNCKNNDMNTT